MSPVTPSSSRVSRWLWSESWGLTLRERYYNVPVWNMRSTPHTGQIYVSPTTNMMAAHACWQDKLWPHHSFYYDTFFRSKRKVEFLTLGELNTFVNKSSLWIQNLLSERKKMCFLIVTKLFHDDTPENSDWTTHWQELRQTTAKANCASLNGIPFASSHCLKPHPNPKLNLCHSRNPNPN